MDFDLINTNDFFLFLEINVNEVIAILIAINFSINNSCSFSYLLSNIKIFNFIRQKEKNNGSTLCSPILQLICPSSSYSLVFTSN